MFDSGKQNNDISDKEMVNRLLNGFEYEKSDAWKLITTKLGRTLNFNELKHLSILFTKIYNVKTNRFENRNKSLLIKFFQTNIKSFSEFIDRIGYKDVLGEYGGPCAKLVETLEKNPNFEA